MRTYNHPLLFIIALILFRSGCTQQPQELKTGVWRGYLSIDKENPEHILPFFIDVKRNDSEAIVMDIRNADERITLDSVWRKGDSLFMRTPVFDTEFKVLLQGDNMTGMWYNRMRGRDYTIPFFAEYGKTERFPHTHESGTIANVSGKWQVTFGPDTEDSWNAIGEFAQTGNKINGTFLTETGDYRYLEGNVIGNEFFLSSFDGSHAFLFTSKIRPDSSLYGQFYSGKHWSTSWMAYRNPFAELSDPEKLTYLKEGYNSIEFCFPDRFNNQVCLSDDKYKGKVVLVQIMGTWCPNCMDETALYADFYNEYHNKGLEIIALAFEKSSDSKVVNKNIERIVDHYNIGYNVLWAGPALKEEANNLLPMLNNILSYPTTIFIDRKGEIRKIYTGFMGPGTGSHYKTLTADLRMFVEDLLKE